MKNILSQLPKIHGNTKVLNPITGKKDKRLSQWRKAASDAARHLVKAFNKD